MRRMIACIFSIGLGATLLVAVQSCSLRRPITQEPPPTADGSLVLPADFLDDYKVPHDAPQGADATISELGQFAWREFIALCWPATIPTTADQTRANADVTKAFTDTTPPFTTANPQLLVWETYYHKAEMFPYQPKTLEGDPIPPPVPPPAFDTYPPVYKYKALPARPIRPESPTDPMRTQWNNLDETNEISRCTLYAHSSENDPDEDFQILYEAKVNRVYYDYIVANELYALQGSDDRKGRDSVIGTGTDGGLGEYDLLQYGSRSSDTPPSASQLKSTTKKLLVQFPVGYVGSEREGAIEIKPAWRRLTLDEIKSGRFYMNEVQFYETGTDSGGNTYTQVKNEMYGLIALHIIQKTKSFPSFVYATWEQVDNASSGLLYKNSIKPDGGEFPVERKHEIPSAINDVNDAVHRLIKAREKKSVWQYYQLIGVQPNATHPPGPDATQDEVSTFNLANLVVETNVELQSFTGTLSELLNQNLPSINTFKLGRSFEAGGCLGCHGFQGQRPGYDFSVIAAKAPVDFPEPVDIEKKEMLKLMRTLMRLGRQATVEE